MTMPTVTLSNGIRVANFSSPHPFTFADGSVLPACTADRSRSLLLVANETETPVGRLDETLVQWTDIDLDFALSVEVFKALEDAHQQKGVDIILAPFPVIQAVKSTAYGPHFPKLRTVRMADRVSKEAHIDRFCV